MKSTRKTILTFLTIFCLLSVLIYFNGLVLTDFIGSEKSEIQKVGLYASKHLWNLKKEKIFVRFASLKGKARIIDNLRSVDQDTANIHVQFRVQWDYGTLRAVVKKLRELSQPDHPEQFRFFYTGSASTNELRRLVFQGRSQSKQTWSAFKSNLNPPFTKKLINFDAATAFEHSKRAIFLNRTKVVARDASGDIILQSPYVTWGWNLNESALQPFGSYRWLQFTNENEGSTKARVLASVNGGYRFEVVLTSVTAEEIQQIKFFDLQQPEFYYRGKWSSTSSN